MEATLIVAAGVFCNVTVNQRLVGLMYFLSKVICLGIELIKSTDK